MASHRTVVIPVNLGVADWFDRSIFPMSLSKSEAFARGGLFLNATVDEVLSIVSMCTSLSQTQDFAKTTQLRYTELKQEKIRLENRTTTRNPFKEYANYRAVKIFYKAAKSLYIETKTTSELMLLEREPQIGSIEEEGSPRQHERSTSRAKADDQYTSRNNEDSPRTPHNPPSPLANPSEPVSTPRKEEQPVNENLPAKPTIRGIVMPDVDPAKVPELSRIIADAFHAIASNANAPAAKNFMDQLNTLMDGALDPATSRASQAPTKNEISGHSTAPQTSSSPTTSCSARSSIKIVIKDTIIAPGAIFMGTSLSQGHSHNSGPVRHDVTLPPPP